MNGVLCIDNWAGRREIPVEVINEKPKRKTKSIRVKLLKDCLLPNRMGHKDQVILVPKYAVRLT